MAGVPPFVRDSAHLYPFAGGGGGSGTGGGGGALYVGPLSANPDPYAYGQWIVTGNVGPWAGPIASGVFTLMVSNGTTWFPVSTGSGGGSGSAIPEVYATSSAPGSTGAALLWLDIDSGVAARTVPRMPSQELALTLEWADTFNRDNAVGHAKVGNGWTPDPRMLGDLEIFNHTLLLHPGLTSGYQRFYTYAPTALPFTGDIAIEVDWPASSIIWGTGLMCRFDAVSTVGVRCWLTGRTSLALGNTTWFDAGDVALEEIADFPASWGTSEINTLRLELHDEHATIYANDVLVRAGDIDVNVDIADGAVGFCGEAEGRIIDAIRVTPL